MDRQRSRRTTAGLVLAVLACGYVALPEQVASVVFTCAGVVPVVAMCLGIRRQRPAAARPWWLLTAGVALLVLGDAAYTLQDLEGAEPFPSVADGIYLLAYPLLCLGVAGMLRRSRVRDASAWLDAGIWTAGAVVVAWVPLLAPYAHDARLTWVQRSVALAFPVLDLLLLLLVLHLGRAGRLGQVQLLVVLAMASMLLSDTVYAVRSLSGSYHSGEVTDLGWLLCYGLLATAARHPDMGRLALPPLRVRPTTTRHLLALLAPAAACPLVLALLLARRNLRGDVQGGALVAASTVVVFVLAVLRGRVLLGQMQERQVALGVALGERERLSEELRHRASCCGLTGLANRTGFLEQVGTALVRPDPLVLGLLDLDDFKGVNDTLGHDAGDDLLVEVAARLRSALGPHDVVGRLGGDEFAVLLQGDGERAEAIADRIIAGLGQPLVVDGQELMVRGSLGLVTRTDHSALGDLMRRADVAMYDAKARGGNRWSSYQPEMSASLLRRLDLRSQLVTALERREIVPWFQPVVSLDTCEPVGFEALARWCRPGRVAALPVDWLPLAVETGLVVAIDHLVLRQAVAELATWRTLPGGADVTLSVNLSGRTLRAPEAAAEVLAVLTEHAVPPSALVVEVAESELRGGDERGEPLGPQLQALRDAGVTIALDGFGTGWSSLSYLAEHPVDALKLDGSFTRGLGVSASREAVATAVIQLGAGLGLDVRAVSVEDEQQAAWLRRAGVTTGQGYLYGAVEPAARARERLSGARQEQQVG